MNYYCIAAYGDFLSVATVTFFVREKELIVLKICYETGNIEICNSSISLSAIHETFSILSFDFTKLGKAKQFSQSVESQIACWESKIGISYFFYSFGVESRPAAYIMVSTC